MQIYDHSIGVMNADGATEIEAEVCALTGVPILDEHHSRLRLDATHFIRVRSQLAAQVTDEIRAALIASYAPKVSSKTKSAESAVEEKS